MGVARWVVCSLIVLGCFPVSIAALGNDPCDPAANGGEWLEASLSQEAQRQLSDLQTRVDNACAGGVVHVKAGVYSGTLLVTKPVKIYGEPCSVLVGTLVVDFGAPTGTAASLVPGIEASAANSQRGTATESTVIQGFQILGSVRLVNAGSVLLRRVTISGSEGTGLYVHDSEVVVEQSEISEHAGPAIEAEDGSNVTVLKTDIQANGDLTSATGGSVIVLDVVATTYSDTASGSLPGEAYGSAAPTDGFAVRTPEGGGTDSSADDEFPGGSSCESFSVHIVEPTGWYEFINGAPPGINPELVFALSQDAYVEVWFKNFGLDPDRVFDGFVTAGERIELGSLLPPIPMGSTIRVPLGPTYVKVTAKTEEGCFSSDRLDYQVVAGD